MYIHTKHYIKSYNYKVQQTFNNFLKISVIHKSTVNIFVNFKT